MGSTQNSALQEKRGRDGKEETLQLVLNTPHRSIPLLLRAHALPSDQGQTLTNGSSKQYRSIRIHI